MNRLPLLRHIFDKRFTVEQISVCKSGSLA